MNALRNPDEVWPDEAAIAAQHLRTLPHRDQINAEWLAAERAHDRAVIEAELREIVQRETRHD